MTYTLKLFITYTALMLGLYACTKVGSDEWAHINYNDIDCGANASHAAGDCNNDDGGIASVGKSGKR